jgi:muramoyltetrapeptide carboxypeptidase
VTATKPPALRRGDRVAVVAPASPFVRDALDRGAAELQRLGYETLYDDTIFARDDGYLAGAAEVRAAAFMRYWQDPSVRAVIAVRGGYGSVQLLPRLDAAVVARHPKLFIGYSDNTSILTWLTGTCGLPALHGPMLDGRLAKGPTGYDERSFVELLEGRGRGMVLAPAGVQVLREGDAAGPLHGGTITQLTASLGTPYAFDPPAGSVLFLEDVNERPYRIDRMLTQLQLSGVLGRAAALVFGEMRDCREPGGDDRVTARQVIGRAVRAFPGPVLYGFPSGHTTGPCWTLPFGVRVRVRTTPQPGLVVEESPCE